MTDELGLRRDALTEVARAMDLLGHGTADELRELGVDCEPSDLARVARELPDLRVRCTPGGFEVQGTGSARGTSSASADHPTLALKAAERLCRRGEYRRAGTILGELMGAADVRPLVFRHTFDLLNAGHVELVESLVFDGAFGAPEWLREALSALEGLLWAGFRDFHREEHRARGVQGLIEQRIEQGVDGEPGTVPLAQAWSFIELYAAWSDPIPVVEVLPRDLCDAKDPLVRCLWAIRRGRQLAALGHLDQALSILDAAESLVERDSIAGAHLSSSRFLCRALLGQSVEGEELGRVRRASDFASGRHLDLLAFAIDGYREAVLAFVGAREASAPLARLAERSSLHPDPLLHASLRIACAVDAYRRHSFYAALTFVRDLPLELDYLGVTDLVCAAYVLEALCQGAVGEEPCPLDEAALVRPSALGLLPLARAAYGVAQEVFRVMEEIDPGTLAAPFADVEPSYVAARLTDLVLKGSWTQALALGRLLPASWREAAERSAEATAPRGGFAGPMSSEDGRDGEPRPSVAGASAPPKLVLRMLGSYEVWVGERRLTDACWRRRAGKTLIAALIVAPGHSLTRADLCDILWPDRDYLSCRNSLYSVLSSTRETLGCAESEPAYLLCEEGKVALNPKLMECDVDAFEERCREVLSHQGDRRWRLGLCRHLSRSYRGGLVVPAQDVRGEFQARRQALESLYVDMLVEAANLALQVGLAKEALWFANDACARSVLREDTYACRLRALAADGRAHELDDTYRRYCTELSDGLFMAPSARMRTLYASLRRYVQDASEPIGDPSLEAYEESLGTVA